MRKFVLCLFAVTAIFTQTYSQSSWEKDPNPVLPRGASGEWDDQFLSAPYVLFDGTVYYMWYGGYDGGCCGSSIGYAFSSDGIIWIKGTLNNPVLESGPSGSWDEVTVYQPSVFFDGTTYHMWFGGHNDINRRIGYATSLNPINWSKANSDNPVLDLGDPGSWEDDYVDSPDVLFIDNMFHMWYSGNDGTTTQIGHAISSDGITWEKDSLNPVLKVGATGHWDEVGVGQPSVLFNGTTYHMWYSGGKVFEWSIGYAYSSDGSTWTKDSTKNPVLVPGSFGSWESSYVGLCGVIFDNAESRFKMWYAGGVGFVDGDIGYAFTPPVSVEDNNLGELPQEFSLLQNYPNPFNPTTRIKYQIPDAGLVSLQVYNLLGEVVATLVNEEKSAGTYEVEFSAIGGSASGGNAYTLPSGIYFYKLQAGSFVETNKMILMK